MRQGAVGVIAHAGSTAAHGRPCSPFSRVNQSQTKDDKEVSPRQNIDKSLLFPRYKSLAERNDMIVQHFLSACLHSDMPEKVVPMYEEAEANRWPLRIRAVDIVVRAMHEMRRPRDEILAFYKSWVERTGNELNQRPAFVALLESGITVGEIRSMRYKEPSRLANRLIQALTTMGRTEEAREIVQEILEPEGGLKQLGVLTLVSLLR